MFVTEMYKTEKQCPQCGSEMNMSVLRQQNALCDADIEEIVCINPLCGFVGDLCAT